MSVWLWMLLAITAFFAVSLVVGLLMAAILANIGRAFSGLIELEPLESSPLRTRPAPRRKPPKSGSWAGDPVHYGSGRPVHSDARSARSSPL
jgi:nitrogen fixation protein FixH